MKRQLTAVCAVLACAVLAVTAASAQTGKHHATVTINFMTYVWQPTTVAATKQIVASWNASHPNIKVNEIQIDPNTVHDYMVTNFAGGTAPDIVHDEAADIAGFTQQGYIADIRKLIPASLRASIAPRVWDSVTFGRKVTAVPTLLQTYNVFANVDALKAAGVKLPTVASPWTWAQFRVAAKKLTGNGKFGVGWGLKSPTSVSMSLALNFGGTFFYFDKAAGKWVVKVTPAESKYLTTVHDMIWQDGSIDPAAVGSSGGGVLPGFFAGKYAMTIQGNYAAQQMISDAPAGFHWALLPLLKGTSQDQMADPQTYSVTSQSQHKAEAVQFLAYLANAQNMQKLAGGDWLIPSNPAAGKALIKSTKHYGSWKVAISSLPDLRQHPLNYLVNYPRFKSQIATPALQAYFQNKSSLSDLSTALSSGWTTVNTH
jgi:ABC-type glycerol-3-phosphate transport system substrate-binding protein